jgi:hypothetical protein
LSATPAAASTAAEELGAEALGADVLGAEALGADVLGADVLGADVLGADVLGAEALGAGEAPEAGGCGDADMHAAVSAATARIELAARESRRQDRAMCPSFKAIPDTRAGAADATLR